MSENLNIIIYKYKYLSNIILKLEKHINNVYSYYYFDITKKNKNIGLLYDISKKINISYNLLIETNEILENSKLFINEEIIVKDLLVNFGYDNLLELLIIFNKFKLTEYQLNYINEINNLFIPIKISIFNVQNTEEYYWRSPSEYIKTDILKLNKELWLKNSLSDNEYLKIDGFFINDTLSYFIKSSHINGNILQNTKINILEELKNNLISIKFIKKFIKYDYLGNIYTLSQADYIKYIKENYNKFNELSKDNFANIVKKFTTETNNKIQYEYIFLLLLGSNDNSNIASILFNLIKNIQFQKIIQKRLSYNLLKKIKYNEITKIDYKKQLLLNNNIPTNIKNITLEKIEEMKLNSNEYYKQLLFVKTILNFPWVSETLFNKINSINYLNEIEHKLISSSYGHNDAKQLLLQTIGKWISNPSSNGTCFGLVGPPGVGKTLLAKSLGYALNIPFSEITLGGQNDGELLYGHGYTYSGSQPGIIIKKMVEMGKAQCILYFDELDKTGLKNGIINEITSILIHLTDPNMNKSFQDRFFQGIDFPLDKVIFIFSYNDSKLIDPILLDRIKEIEIKAYTTNEKIKIVQDFILPELIKNININFNINIKDDKLLFFEPSLIEFIIDNYTNEAGVRDIKRKIEQILLSLNLDNIYKRNKCHKITKEIIIKILNKPKLDIIKINNTPEVGIINGLYTTLSGSGGIMPIQIFNNYLSNKNSFEIKITGNQGTIMVESIYCALTTALNYIQNINADLLNNFNKGFHVHIPSVSTPKDGPSAGSAFTCAFISRILNFPIKNNIAITGEIDITGKITKIGGLEFKLIGAKKAGVNLVYIPNDNNTDIEDIKIKYPLLITKDFNIILCSHIKEIINNILIK